MDRDRANIPREELVHYFAPGENEAQTHVHEFLGSTRQAGEIVHNHRFAGVSSQAIPAGKNHVHAILTNTDFDIEHLHELGVLTGLAIYIGSGRHVHCASGKTTISREHFHEFIFTTLIEDPPGSSNRR